MWSCPKCKRVFSRRNQRHACGTGNRAEVIRGRPESLVQLLSAIEEFARSLGPIEVVSCERYVLLRSTRIFADLVMMSDAVRIAIHLRQKVAHPLFFKVGANDRGGVTHVAKIQDHQEFESLKSYLKEGLRRIARLESQTCLTRRCSEPRKKSRNAEGEMERAVTCLALSRG